MAANIEVKCSTCGQGFGLRFEPDTDHGAPMLAQGQLERECPEHEGKEWQFWEELKEMERSRLAEFLRT